MTPAVAEVRDLHKYFTVVRPLHEQLLAPLAKPRRICVLKNVSLRVASGETLGIIGPNGAGKTTLLRVLADLLEPDAGWVEICGQRLTRRRNHLRYTLGYVSSDERSFFWRLTGRQNLEFFAGLYGISRREAHERICALLDLFALREKASQLFRDYSSGTRKKFAVARALIHRPKVILLDEVTNSLDPPSAQAVKALVRDYVCQQGGRAALWSTHRLEEIGEICDKVIVIDEGRVDYAGPVDEVADASSEVAKRFAESYPGGPARDSCGVLLKVTRSRSALQRVAASEDKLSEAASGARITADH